MAEDYEILKVRCILGGETFDFNQDLGAVEVGRGAACTLSEALGLTEAESQQRLERLLKQHSREWKNFMDSLGKNSFIKDWVSGEQ